MNRMRATISDKVNAEGTVLINKQLRGEMLVSFQTVLSFFKLAG